MSSAPSLCPVIRALVVATWCAAVAAQDVRVVVPIGAGAQGAQGEGITDGDPGTPVDMFENPDLDRYLHKAQACIEREDFDTAIDLLQVVIEGRTHEVPGDDEPAATPAPTAPPGGAPGSSPAGSAPRPRQDDLDARNSLFSQDGRIYRPVRRLCHELLARMPALGLEIYRARHEVAAEELFEQALRDGSATALEQVADRYFVTLPAGRAMALLADRWMHEGRYRGAVLVLRDLLDVYPAPLRQRLGISDVWGRFKIALCLRLAGETESAHDAVQALAAGHPDESLRVQGELQAVKDLPADRLFARDVAAVAAPPVRGSEHTFLAGDPQELVGLWQFRFRNPNPYKDPKPTNQNNHVFFDGSATGAAMPFAGRYGPATWVRFFGDGGVLPHAMFFEHYRLREVDATSGLLLAHSDGNDEPPIAREQHPRVRSAAHDFALLRPVESGDHRYAVLGARTSSTSPEALAASELVAYDAGWAQVWSSKQWEDGDGGLRGVTFLAAPTVFGERLLLPSLRRGKYSLECLERATGRPMWNAPVHGGGSPFFKAPGCPVVVQGGTAYLATNAGCIASIDAFTGDLRWVRRYERVDPLRHVAPRRTASRGGNMMQGMPGVFRQEDLPGFHPSDLFVVHGLVIAAPCDGDMLLGLDGATGQPQWMLDGATRYASYGRLRGLVGVAGEDLFAWSDTHLVAIGATGGLLKWARELPATSGSRTVGRGRGTIVGDRILMPGEREVLVYGTDGAVHGRLPLPAFDPSREPLSGSCNLVAHGPWLAVGFAGGVEMFSTRPALRQLAEGVDDPLRRADLLVRAGAVDEALSTLTAALRATPGAERERALGDALLALVRDRAFATAGERDAAAGLALLDEIAPLLRAREVRLAWHLARVELAKERGDLTAHEAEQNRLYAYMEGKG